jgi:hypothetical protein
MKIIPKLILIICCNTAVDVVAMSQSKDGNINLIAFFHYQNGMFVPIKLDATLDTKISSIKNSLAAATQTLPDQIDCIYRGETLISNYTLRDYRMKGNVSIYAAAKGNPFAEKWNNVTDEIDAFSVLAETANCSKRLPAIRADERFRQILMRQRSESKFGKLVYETSEAEYLFREKLPLIPTVFGDPPTGPSIEPLPYAPPPPIQTSRQSGSCKP